ncbi:uncharacterized protein F5Z01DRAFT_175838 [Emericellopsis atlantica]|uniref:3'-5' exonuclease domain-containing protein n=1 Tax=Emericellopsis atlantica TaxID=2614577 RepID=A0A9P7ZJC5_9HYPO|nr:uncharacterized protein F5Z01DRAFT_175838 [Emericellopsis atlantica]KAG9253149.1 hypothetical protein F5Z01DRAFT_175838 [Emericellopsis atlantica]
MPLPWRLVNTTDRLKAMLDVLGPRLSSAANRLYISIQGTKDVPPATVALLLLHVAPTSDASEVTYIVDVYTIGARAFTTLGPDRRNSLKMILQSPFHQIVGFDLRHDLTFLEANYGIKTALALDIQLMECLSRPAPTAGGADLVASDLPGCIAHLDAPLRIIWEEARAHNDSVPLWCRRHRWTTRPLAPHPLNYAVQELRMLPRLLGLYRRRMSDKQFENVLVATREWVGSVSFRGGIGVVVQGGRSYQNQGEWLARFKVAR